MIISVDKQDYSLCPPLRQTVIYGNGGHNERYSYINGWNFRHRLCYAVCNVMCPPYIASRVEAEAFSGVAEKNDVFSESS